MALHNFFDFQAIFSNTEVGPRTSASMPLHNFEDSTLSAPDHDSQFTSGTNIDSSYHSSTRLGGIITQPVTDSRLPHDHEVYVMKAFARHASRCSICAHPYEVHLRGGSLCSKGDRLALDVTLYVFNKTGRTSSVVDLESSRRLQMEIPADCVVVRELLVALKRGLRLSRKVLDEPPSVLLTQYPEFKDLDLAHISPWQDAPTGRDSGLDSNASGYESALHLDPSDPLSISRPRKALRHFHSSSFLPGIQIMPPPPLQNIPPMDIPTLLPDRPETSEDSGESLVKATPSGDESDCEGFSRGIELSGHQIDSQGTSGSEGRSTDNVSHESKETAFAQERACEKDGNSHLSDNSEGSLSTDESSSNSSSENGYNDTSERSVLNCSQRALISRLMDEICSSFFYQVSHRPRQHGQGGQGSRETSSSSTEQTTTTNSSIGEFSGSWRKRSQKEDGDPEDEDDGKRKRLRNQNSDDGHSTRVRYFACPFHKLDASTYGTRNADPRVGLKYRSCGPPGWPNIGKLKEHLYRKHQTPIHCPRCWTIMKTEAALGEHARTKNQCDILPPPQRWIPREVCEKLKNRKKAFAGQTEEDTWTYIFGLLFPDCPNVPSPYYNDSITLEEMTQRNSPTSNAIAAYEEYARAHLPRLFEEALETAVAEQMQPIEEGLRRSLAGIVRDCQTRLAQNFLRHRSSNVSSIGGAAAVQAEVLPPFYIEPLSLAEDIISINPTQIFTNGHDGLQTHSDSGYASVEPSLNRNSSRLFADLRLQNNNLGSLHDSTIHGIDTNFGSEFVPEFSNWAALMGNNQDNNDFSGNGLCDGFT